MKNIEEYASLNYVPIMQKNSMEFIKKFIKKNNIKNILELGSAIGYSSINMALVDDDIHITTIERDIDRYNECVKNINRFNLNNRIIVINDDIYNYNTNLKFDLILIDAAKSQNQGFFLKFQDNLEPQGFIITDNMDFHGLTDNENIKSRNLRQLVRKINEYKDFLNNNNDFITEFLSIGDGLAISCKR